MSIEGFVTSLRSQLSELNSKRESSMGPEKTKLTRKINDINDAIEKATRKGIQ